MKNKNPLKKTRMAVAALLCMIFCTCLLPAAFADGMIIIGSAEPGSQQPGYEPALILSGQNGSLSDNTLTRFDDTQAVVITPDTAVQAAPAPQATGKNGSDAAKSAPSGLAGEILAKTNEVRRANGLSALSYAADLQGSADTRAYESAISFSHTRPDGSSCHSVIGRDYRVAGENLLQVSKELASVEIIMDTWMNSDTHRANILLADFSQLAVGFYEQDGVLFISQIFLG